MTSRYNDFDLFGWVPESWRLVPEYDILGFYITPMIFIILASILLGALTVWAGGILQLNRLVWHPPLFLLALIFVYGFLLSLMFLPR